MLLEEDPAYLIRTTISHFNTNLDKDAVSRIHDSLASLAQARELRLRETDNRTRKLARTMTTLSQQHEDAMLDWQGGEHASQVVDLDTKKFRIAKTISDLDMENARFEQDLTNSQARLQRLQHQGLQGDQLAASAAQQDPNLLRLKIYRSLGIDPRTDQSGVISGAIVRNMSKGDVHVVDTASSDSTPRIWAAMA